MRKFRGEKRLNPLWRTVWRLLKKLEIELPYDPAIPLLGIHTEETRRERDTWAGVQGTEGAGSREQVCGCLTPVPKAST